MTLAPHASRAVPTDWIGRAAVVALYDELALFPKPGLVSFVDRGSHDDMDATSFMRSLFALRGYFVEVAALGAADEPFKRLQAAGLAAEARMQSATGGINTHRGAIFTLGLLCAAAGVLVRQGLPIDDVQLRRVVREHWGDALVARRDRPRASHGRAARAALGLRGVEDEAIDGFPVLFDRAVPTLLREIADGTDVRRARLQTFFTIVATLDDTNLAHRGGHAGLVAARALARRFLDDGGVHAPDAELHAEDIHRAFVARRLSPGGAADVLAAACWYARVRAH